MKKTVIIIIAILVVAAIGAGVFVIAGNRPEIMLLNMKKSIETDGIAAIEKYLSSELQPIFKSALSVINQSWVAGIIGQSDLQKLLKAMDDTPSLSFEIADIRSGRSTASVLINMDSSLIHAQISLEMVKQNNTWLINGFSIPSLRF